ncbi:MAG: hypothetical protein HYX59_11925 [Elusimicrobia bacterium]|nr:hypothetical protein [Elusimicrobiota bacterium]
MGRNKLPFAVLLAALALCLGQAAFYFRRLPYLAVSHFNAQGLPNGYMDRGFLVGLYVAAELLVAGAFLLGAFLPSRLPDRWVNLPHKEHWLAPERRGETLDWFARSFLWFGAATLMLLFDVFGQMLSVNLGAASELSHPEASVGAYFAFSALWTAALWRRFGARP